MSFIHPHKTMVLIHPTPDYVEALRFDLPVDFYDPNQLWRVEYTLTATLAPGTRVHRRIQIGDLVISQLSGTCLSSEPAIFQDSIRIPMYSDQLFDAQAVGVNSQSPISAVNKTTSLRDSLSASSEVVTSYYDSPNADRDDPMLLTLWAEPIMGPVSVFINGLSLVNIQ